MERRRPATGDIARAIAQRWDLEGALGRLTSDLSPSELTSILLHVLRERGRGVSFADVLRFTERSNLVHPCDLDARLLHAVDRLALDAASRFTAVELSPVAPFGLHCLTGIDQNNVLSATRGSEVLADSTTVLAVECARRRRKGQRQTPLRLATSSRLIRMQPFDDPGFSRHFRLFALATSGRDSGDESFERKALLEHLEAWLLFVEALRLNGFAIPEVRVEISDLRIVRGLLVSQGVPCESLRGHVSPQHWPDEVRRRGLKLPGPTTDPSSIPMPTEELRRLARRLDRVRDEVFRPLQQRFAGLRAEFDLSRLHGLGYYSSLALHVHLRGKDGVELPVGDGGFTDWTQQLLSDRKERFLGSAMGTEMLCRLYRA